MTLGVGSASYLLEWLSSSAWVSTVKYHRLVGLKYKNLLSHSSGGGNPRSRCLVGLVSPEASPWLVDGQPLLSVSLHPLPSLHVCVSSCPLFIRTSIMKDKGPPEWSHFRSLSSVKALCSRKVPFWGSGGGAGGPDLSIWIRKRG